MLLQYDGACRRGYEKESEIIGNSRHFDSLDSKALRDKLWIQDLGNVSLYFNE